MISTAFTLVELLVAIGILAALAGILLPTIGRVREQADRVRCMANLRQVHLTLRHYADASRNRVPIGYRAGFKQFNSMAYSKTSGKFCLFGVLHVTHFMDDPRVFFCPSNRDPQSSYSSESNRWPPVTGGDNVYVGYGFNPKYELEDELQRVPGAFAPTLLSFKSDPLVADLTATPDRLDSRHGSGVNVLYGDGSCVWVSRTVFNDALSACPAISKDANPYQDQIWATFYR